MKRFHLFYFVLPATLVLIFGAVFSAVAVTYPSSLVSYWPFDTGSGTVALDEVGTNDGILVNGPLWTTGQVNGAVRFDGVDDYVVVPDSENFSVSEEALTVEAWIYPETTSAEIIIVKKGSGGCDYFNFFIHFGHLALLSSHGCTWSQEGVHSVVVPNVWQHVAATYDGTFIRYYVNGILTDTVAGDGLGAVTSGGYFDEVTSDSIKLGHHPGWILGEYYRGVMDEVAMYDVALSSVEILEHYEHGLEGVLYFDEMNTPVGTNITVAVDDVTITFSEVTSAGETTITVSESGEEIPGSFQIGDPPAYYFIETNASFVGLVEICFSYNDSGLNGSEENLKVLHFQDGVWIDATVSLDMDANIICVEVTSFSTFTLATQNSIEGLIQHVGEMNFEKGIAMSLVQKLYAAQRTEERATARTTARVLEAFVREVNALSASQVTSEQADELVVYATSLLSLL